MIIAEGMQVLLTCMKKFEQLHHITCVNHQGGHHEFEGGGGHCIEQ